MNLNRKEKSIFPKKFYKNSNITKYYTTKSKYYVLYLTKTYNEKILKSEFPKIYTHISKFKELIIKIRNRNNEKFEKWINLDRPREEFIFTSNKIVAPQRSNVNTFGYNEIDFYASADVYYIIQNNKEYSLKYILALLNSKLYYLWLYHRGKRKGEMLELYQKPLSEIPIKKISEEKQQPFIELVEKIIEKKKDDPEADTGELEKEIDKLVYELYELTPEEIKIVEKV